MMPDLWMILMAVVLLCIPVVCTVLWIRECQDMTLTEACLDLWRCLTRKDY